MKWLALLIFAAFFAHPVYSQSEPTVAVDNISIIHENRGWRVTQASTTPIHFNLIKGDLIIRIDSRNAADSGPMLMASLLNEGYRRPIPLFIERGGFRMEVGLRETLPEDYEPVGANPLKHVASGFSAPDAEFTDIDGQAITLEQFKGKWLLVDFTATWCPPCMESLPKILSAADGNQVSLLIVALDDKAEAVHRMQMRYSIKSPIAMMKAMAQLPIDFGITTNRWTGQIPAFALIRPDGEVALIAIGAVRPDQIVKTIQCVMNCKANEELK